MFLISPDHMHYKVFYFFIFSVKTGQDDLGCLQLIWCDDLWVFVVWQSSRPASFSPAGLTLWPSWLERWLTTLSGLSVQVRNQWGCRDITLGARPQAWVKLSALIVHSEPTDCHVSLWPGENGGLPDRGVWCYWGREECDNPAGLLASRQRVWPFGRVG